MPKREGRHSGSLAVAPLYVDPDSGRPIATQSMIKTFRRCPKQAEFKYKHRLKPKRAAVQLRRGDWMHLLLEADSKGKDWEKVHKRLSAKFGDLMDDEKEYYGDLPRECERLMKSYLWHYKSYKWKVLEVEYTIEVDMPDGSIYRAKVDLLVETEFGLYLVDHKTHKRLPGLTFRFLDPQSALYLGAARRAGIPVQGFIWNYLRTVAPTKPKMLADGSRLSRAAIDTDYLTFRNALREYGLPEKQFKEKLKYLKAQRYRHGEPQTSSFFRRETLEKDDSMVDRVFKEALTTVRHMNTYNFSDADAVERVVDRSCEWSCAFDKICALQLFGGNIAPIVKQEFTVGDPMSYYQDRAGDYERQEQ